MKTFLARIGAAVRTALNKPILPELAARVHTVYVEAERVKEHAARSRLPQWLRLLQLARSKRQYPKRRLGNSAATVSHSRGRRQGGQKRLARVTGPGSYDAYKARLAAIRAARRVTP